MSQHRARNTITHGRPGAEHEVLNGLVDSDEQLVAEIVRLSGRLSGDHWLRIAIACAVPKPKRRCGRCGYMADTNCTCPGGPRG